MARQDRRSRRDGIVDQTDPLALEKRYDVGIDIEALLAAGAGDRADRL
jgi:hypothetical protein